MPPRYAYWTIIVDNQPTAFRSGSQEELMPTFKRLKAKNDTAVMMWFQNGKLWPSRVDAQEAMIARGAMGRRGDDREPGTGFRDRDRRPGRPATSERRDSKGDRGERTAWTPRGEPSTPPAERNTENKLDWKPKGDFVPAPKRAERPDWNSKTSRPSTYAKASVDKQAFKPSSPQAFKPSRTEKPEWKPKGSFVPAPRRTEKADWKPKPSFDRDDARPDWKSRSSSSDDRPRSFKRPDFKQSADDSRSAKPEWKPKGSFVPAPRRTEKSDWKPKPSFDRDARPDWKSKSSSSEDRPRSFKRPDFKQSADDSRSAKPEWKPKGSFVPAPRRSEKPDWKSKPSFDRERKTEWKPKPSFDRDARPDWKSKSSGFKKPAWTPNRDSGGRFSAPDRERAPRTEKLDWKPKGEKSGSGPQDLKIAGPDKRKWVPKEEYKKSMGIEARRDSKWRPGGEHKDPRQKYKDAKKAKWSKFKQNIRARSGGKGKKSS